MSFTKFEDAIIYAEKTVKELNWKMYIYDFMPENMHKYYYVTNEYIDLNEHPIFKLLKTLI